MCKKLLVTTLIASALFISGCDKKSDAPVTTTTAPAAAPAPLPPSDQRPDLGTGVNEGETRNIMDRISAKYPQIKVSKISQSPVPGFYQLSANGDVLYVSGNGDYMFIGDLMALNQNGQANLTEEVRKESRLSLLNGTPESDMVVFEPKSGKPDYTVTVFTDIDCGYCRKFHQEMNSYLDKNIKVRYMAFPRAGKDSESYKKAQSVWCSKDRNEAMNQAKLTETFKADEKLCDNNAIDKSMDVVRKLGINGTPAILAEDGTLLPGYMPAEALKNTLDSLKKNQLTKTQSNSTAG